MNDTCQDKYCSHPPVRNSAGRITGCAGEPQVTLTSSERAAELFRQRDDLFAALREVHAELDRVLLSGVSPSIVAEITGMSVGAVSATTTRARRAAGVALRPIRRNGGTS